MDMTDSDIDMTKVLPHRNRIPDQCYCTYFRHGVRAPPQAVGLQGHEPAQENPGREKGKLNPEPTGFSC